MDFQAKRIAIPVRVYYNRNSGEVLAMTDFSQITACGECCEGCEKRMKGFCRGCIEADGYVPEWAGSVLP